MQERLGLCLSGGGVRAAVFHLGVLKRFADENLLERVTEISTVSGGSLAIAALFARSGMAWPSSQKYRDETYTELRALLTSKDLFSLKAIGWSGLLFYNVRLFGSRAKILSHFLQKKWRITATVAELPDTPRWQINATCFETGKNWRFSKRSMGDWVFGKHFSPEILLADAAAASAAVPYVIGTLRLNLPADGWWQTDPKTKAPIRKITVPKNVRLWDGGVYENMGLEALFKPGKDGGLEGCDFLICSDASAPLQRNPESLVSKFFRGHLPSPRLFDISSDQIRWLRHRMFFNDAKAGNVKGQLLQMGTSIRQLEVLYGHTRPAKDYDQFQSDQEVDWASKYPTDLAALSGQSFDAIARHGYELANATLRVHCSAHFKTDKRWLEKGAV
jgi:NTE family protein